MRIAHDGTSVSCVTAFVSKNSLMELVSGVYNGEYRIEDFSKWDAEKFTLAAVAIQRHLAKQQPDDG